MIARIERVRFWFLRQIYRFLYWLGQYNVSENKLLYGFYRKYPHPDLVPSDQLVQEIRRLGKDIEGVPLK